MDKSEKLTVGFDPLHSGLQDLANTLSSHFVNSSAVNFVQLQLGTDELGDFTITMQRADGITPVERIGEIESQRDELLAALKRISNWRSHSLDFAIDQGSNGVRDYYRSIADKAIAKCEPTK